MGLFGNQPKQEVKTVPPVEVETEEPFEEFPSLPKPRTNTTIAKEITVSGTISGEGVVQVEGVIEGEVNLKGSVIVTTTGMIKGPISADVIRVAGNIVGSVSAKDHLRLEKTGSLEGDVTTASLVVEDGGHLNGRTTMVKQAPGPMPSPDSVPAPEDLKFGPNYKIGSEEESET